MSANNKHDSNGIIERPVYIWPVQQGNPGPFTW